MGSMFEKIPVDKLIEVPSYMRWLVIVMVCLLIVVLDYFLVFQGQQEEINNVLKVELSKKEKEYKTNLVYAGRLEELKDKIVSLNKDLNRAKKRLPKEREIPDLLKKVSHLATTAGLEVITFKPGAEIPKDFYSEVPVKVRVTGRFHNTLAFFDEVSRLSRIVTTSNINMKKTKNEAQEVILSTDCRVTTYRFLEEKARKPKEMKKERSGN